MSLSIRGRGALVLVRWFAQWLNELVVVGSKRATPIIITLKYQSI